MTLSQLNNNIYSYMFQLNRVRSLFIVSKLVTGKWYLPTQLVTWCRFSYFCVSLSCLSCPSDLSLSVRRRSGSPQSAGRSAASSSDRPRPLSSKEEEARRTREAFAQLKRKLGSRRPTAPANGVSAGAGAARPAAAPRAGAADNASSSLVAEMAEVGRPVAWS